MTDKELAEDYAEHNQGKYTNEFGNLYHAFLAGLKAGLQWHDLRKNPNDLPKEKVDVYVLYSGGKVDVKHLEWNKEWWGNGTYCSFTSVTHWKEIVLPEEK